jgi:predicted HTH transcriptional regulator
MRQGDFEELLSQGEIGGVEMKSTQPLTSPRPLKIIRAILGLSNRRSGGHLIIGVAEDDDGRPVLGGMNDGDLETWSEDAAADVMSEYGEPRPGIRLEKHEDDAGRSFVVIRVYEFHEQPILCKKDGGDGILRRGALYIRPRGRAQTVENGSMEDMRALLELGTEKRLHEFLRTADRAGARIESKSASAPPDDAALYDQELGGYLDDE